MQADPVVMTQASLGGMNRYSYVLNNPMRYVDPTGFTFVDCSRYDQNGEVIYKGECYQNDDSNLEWRVANDSLLASIEQNYETEMAAYRAELAGVRAARHAAQSQGESRLSADLRQNPLFTKVDDKGNHRLTDYWLQKLQPFYANRDFDLRQVTVRFQSLSGDKEGKTNYLRGSRTITIDSMISRMRYAALDTFLHESMHLIQGDRVGAVGMFLRSISDNVRVRALSGVTV